MEKKTTLPEYWAIEAPKNREWEPFKKVLAYLNRGTSAGNSWSGYGWNFYGVDGSGLTNGSNVADKLGQFAKPVQLITLDQFISMTEEKEEWKPVKGDKILVADAFDQKKGYWHVKTFLEMKKDGYYACSDSFMSWKYAKPFKEPDFEPTVGKVCWMHDGSDDEDDGINYVFVGKSGSKFIGCSIDEWGDIEKGYEGVISTFKYAEPARKETKEVTFSEVAQKFDTTVDKLKIKGYVNEQDALHDVIALISPKSKTIVLEKDGVRFHLNIERQP